MRRSVIVVVLVVAILIAAVILLMYRSGSVRTRPAVGGTALLKVYGPDPEAIRLEAVYTVSVPDTMSLAGRVALLAEKVSQYCFKGLPIQLARIDSSSGSRIAVINLAEADRTGHSWRTGFFQGSTGGHFTTASLVETFLQRDSEGQWIDGVEFLYEGEPVSQDWDHIRLSRTWFRFGAQPE